MSLRLLAALNGMQGFNKLHKVVRRMGPLELRHIPHSRLYVSNPTDWLESRFHFSFAEYFNPENQEFGVLRVLNDDLVKPHSGFPKHPHRNMEILTYVIDGELTHKDSMGSAETLGRGSVQYMSAGSGVTHSEMNHSNNMLRFLQIWIKPDADRLKPNYGSRRFLKEDRHNKLQQVVTNFKLTGKDTGSGLIPIHQDVAVYVAELDPGVSQSLTLRKGRQAYGVCIEGGMDVGDGLTIQEIEGRDAFEVINKGGSDAALHFRAGASGAHMLIIEMRSEDD